MSVGSQKSPAREAWASVVGSARVHHVYAVPPFTATIVTINMCNAHPMYLNVYLYRREETEKEKERETDNTLSPRVRERAAAVAARAPVPNLSAA